VIGRGGSGLASLETGGKTACPVLQHLEHVCHDDSLGKAFVRTCSGCTGHTIAVSTGGCNTRDCKSPSVAAARPSRVRAGSFGLPQAHDDDAEQAVRAALDIVAGVEQLAASLDLDEHDLRVRVGVNTGEVLVNPSDDTSGGGWRLTGDVANVAARLQSKAHPGTVLVGADTAIATENAMVLEQAGDVAVTGKSAPVPVWTVVSARDSSVHTGPSGLARTPALGREDELARLLASWRAATASGSVWLVMAARGRQVPPGRRVHEPNRRCRRRRLVNVRRSRCRRLRLRRRLGPAESRTGG